MSSGRGAIRTINLAKRAAARLDAIDPHNAEHVRALIRTTAALRTSMERIYAENMELRAQLGGKKVAHG